MTIRPVAEADHSAVHALTELFAAEEGGLFPPPSRAAIGAYLGDSAWVAEVDGRVVGFARMRPVNGRTSLDGVVHPDARRRGLGRAFYERAATECGGILTAVAGDGQPGEPFLLAMGMKRVHAERASVLDLNREFPEPVPVPGYDLVHWLDGAAGPVPDSLLDDLADLSGRLSTDAPTGDLIAEPAVFTPERVTELSDMAARLGQVRISTGARDRVGGRLIAVTTMRHDGTSERLMQLITLVHPDHRGKNLGRLIKLANLEQARSVAPDATTVVSMNAVGNEHMWRVNEAMGFTTVGIDGWYQAVVG